MSSAELTRRQLEMAELIAWGATKKDVANRLHISVRTVETTMKAVFQKTGVTKVNELAAWWFCHRFNISIQFSPLKKSIVSLLLVVIMLPQITRVGFTPFRAVRSCRSITIRPRRND